MHYLLLMCGLLVPTLAAAQPFALVVHGGAGTIRKEDLTPELDRAYRAALDSALRAGYAVLTDGGSAEEAVVRAIVVLEDSPLFNAGRGAVYTHEGGHELDASLMNGATGQAGAVAGVSTVRNPILAARAVLHHSPHVLLSGPGAEAFAAQQGLPTADSAYFGTENRYKQLERARQAERIELDHDGQGAAPPDWQDRKFGTVGAVALDREGHLAAGTSTGGMTNKRYGRVGDSPLVGAGTYAEDATCAVSATGHGEYFIRNVVAYDIAARMAYAGRSVQQAADEVVKQKLVERGGAGGVIALDRKGNVAMPFNTPGMFRGYIKAPGQAQTFIYKE